MHYAAQIVDGSSPLSRGIRPCGSGSGTTPRIIPALAGNTGVPSWCSGDSRDHPRSRGEYSGSYAQLLNEYGSSPLSRGIRHEFIDLVRDIRIIPALAGNTNSGGVRNSAPPDHPRSRGEYDHVFFVTECRKGSSPLSRGIQMGPTRDSKPGRIIPALAGNTQRETCEFDGRWDHPRSRGEYIAAAGKGGHIYGSSPLSRGIPALCWKRTAPTRIIPALAGNTGVRTMRLGVRPDHPRSRGEYDSTNPSTWMVTGSSPLSRGIPGSRRFGPRV